MVIKNDIELNKLKRLTIINEKLFQIIRVNHRRNGLISKGGTKYILKIIDMHDYYN